jgi:phosphoribosylanthranilate isomerase
MKAHPDIRIKVCGMRDADNIAAVANVGPDYMGFIFYPGSPRYVGTDFKVPESLPSSITRVGVFVNETTANMLVRAKALSLDHLQLHGHESVDQCSELRDHGLTVIKAFSVSDDFDFARTEPYARHVDYFLFDTKGKHFGGNAAAFNWRILDRYNQQVPFFLSGGLSPENIGEIDTLNGMNLYALDINSGIESSPGRKNVQQLMALLSRLES